MKGCLYKIAIFLLALIVIFALFLYVGTYKGYSKNYFSDREAIGKRVMPLEGNVVHDITNRLESDKSCPGQDDHSKLVGNFTSYYIGLLLNESDPSFSKEECIVVESYECNVGFISSAFSSGHEGYIVDCNGSHISLDKSDVDNNFGLEYVNKNVEDKALIGKTVRPSKGSVAIDINTVPVEVMKNKIGCPTNKDYSKLKGYFSRSMHNYNLGQDLGLRLRGSVLNESDPTFSTMECKIVESFECVPAENRFGVAMSDEGYIVDCGGVHIVLPKKNAFLEEQ